MLLNNMPLWQIVPAYEVSHQIQCNIYILWKISCQRQHTETEIQMTFAQRSTLRRSQFPCKKKLIKKWYNNNKMKNGYRVGVFFRMDFKSPVVIFVGYDWKLQNKNSQITIDLYEFRWKRHRLVADQNDN